MRLFQRKGKFSKARLCTCLGCLGLPVLLLITLFTIYSWHNRPVNIVIGDPPALPAVNARDDFLNAGYLARNMINKSIFDSDHKKTYTRAEYADCARSAVPVVEALQIGLTKPYTAISRRGPEVIDQSNDSDIAIYRDLAKAVAGAALHYDILGEHARAMDMRLDCLEMALMIATGGSTRDALNSSDVATIAFYNIEYNLKMLTSKQLADASERLNRIRKKLVDYGSLMAEEGNINVLMYQDSLKREGGWRERFKRYHHDLHFLDNIIGPGPKQVEWWEFIKIDWADKNAVAQGIQKFYNGLSSEFQGPFHRPLKKQMPLGTPPLFGSDTVNDAWGIHLVLQSKIDLLRIELALHQYKADNKRFPQTLAELVPKYIPVVPVDPFNNNSPYIYTVRGDLRISLYGLGPDMIDHKGTPGQFSGQKGFDIVTQKLGQTIGLPEK
ncbi:MAG: hypothetical protein ABJA67_06340 [Chthonomonadales bacterium]